MPAYKAPAARVQAISSDAAEPLSASTHWLNETQTSSRSCRRVSGELPSSGASRRRASPRRRKPAPYGSVHRHGESSGRRSRRATSARAPRPSAAACAKRPSPHHRGHVPARPREPAKSPAARDDPPCKSASPRCRDSADGESRSPTEDGIRRGSQAIAKAALFLAVVCQPRWIANGSRSSFSVLGWLILEPEACGDVCQALVCGP